MATTTRTVQLVPSSYTGLTGMTISSSYPVTNAYNDETNETYCRFSISTSSTGSVYFTFDASAIPSDAVITGVTAKAKVRVSSTSRVTSTKCQLYSGSTAKGSNSTFASTSSSNVVTLTPGTWTRSELGDLRLLIGGTGSSSSQSKYIYLYGASVTVTYTVAAFDVTVSNSTSATVTVSNATPAEGDTVEVIANTLAGSTVTDNGTDVTGSFVHGVSDSASAVPGSDVTTGFSDSGAAFYQSSSTSSDSWLRYAVGHGAEDPYSTSNTSNTYVKPEGDTGWMDYPFDFSAIPAGATIDSVSVKVYGARENATVDSTHVARFQCYSGSTAKGTIQDFTSTSNGIVTVADVGTWTRAELQDAKLRFEVGYYGGRMLGITWTVGYTLDGYVYTLTSVSADHVLVFSSGGAQPELYAKVNGSWVQVQAAYRKVNGEWVQQALDSAFQTGVDYVAGW